MLIGICLSKFDIYQGTVASNCFKNHVLIFVFCLVSGLKFTLSEATSFLLGNLLGLKKNIQACMTLERMNPLKQTININFLSQNKNFCLGQLTCKILTEFNKPLRHIFIRYIFLPPLKIGSGPAKKRPLQKQD